MFEVAFRECGRSEVKLNNQGTYLEGRHAQPSRLSIVGCSRLGGAWTESREAIGSGVSQPKVSARERLNWSKMAVHSYRLRELII